MTAMADVSAGIDHDEIRRALAHYEGAAGRVSVMYLQEQGAVPTYASYATTTAELEQAVRDIVKADLVDEPLGIYVRGTTVADGVSGRGGSDDTVTWLSFRADLDLAKPGGPATWDDLFDAFDRANLPTPTYWQHSGGGFYPTWVLAEPAPHAPEVETLAADIEAELRRAWQAAGYTSGVDSCHDAARVWRLAGSVHRKNRDTPITSTVGKFSGEVLTVEQVRERTPRRERPAGWDGQRSAPRRATAQAFEQTYLASQAACRERGRDHFRHTFFVAARNAHRMTALGLRTPDEARTDLLALVQTFWPEMGLNGDDRRHIHDALNNGLDRGDNAGALASPWELSAAPADEFFSGGRLLHEGASEVAQLGYDPVAAAQAAEDAEVQAELRKRRIRRRADEIERPPAPPIAEGLISFSELADIDPPAMLVRRLVPERAVGFLNGRSGSYKSFVLVALAIGMATGKPVAGHHEFTVARPTKVLYVAAEGSAGVALRLRAYAAHHGIRDVPDLTLYPHAINLTSEREVADLEAVIAAGGFEHVLIDTFRQATLGVNESDNSELSVVIGRMIALRDKYGVGTTFADHTGHAGERAVGGEAKWANSDYALMIKMPNGSRTADQQRTLTVEKLKDLDTSGSWDLHLVSVPKVMDGDGNPSAVIEVGSVLASDPFAGIHARWWEQDIEVPDAVVKLSGAGSDAAREIYRVLRYVEDEMTMAGLLKAINERPGGKGYSEPTARRGRVLLENAGVVTAGSTGTRYTLTPTYWAK